ncbi:hypothetical protein [Stutzerimonas xanthomarina]|uniref:hypothetical protein n=1 Tax=Stutzerimonas xanthomarina TaxID=271420 RepID=UPI003AA91FAE
MSSFDVDLAYRFGFLAVGESSNIDDKLVSGWVRVRAGSYNFYVHPELPVKIVPSSGGVAVLLGDVFICRGDSSVEAILSKMLSEDLWDEFDNLSGRFALFLISADDCRVFHDPFGSRTVYYRSAGEFGVSSHSSLLASIFEDEVSSQALEFIRAPEYKMRGTGYLPGDVTMYESINALIPNNGYSQKTRKTFRYWPRAAVACESLQGFLDKCDDYFTNFAKSINGRYNAVLGVTGGVDTRAVIAGLMAKSLPLKLVTWTGGRLPENEVPVVQEMVSHLRQPHVYMDPGAKVTSEKFASIRNAANAATGYCRGASSLTANMGEIVGQGDVFIRGYGGEIVRGFYNRHKSKVGLGLVEDFYSLYKTKRVVDPSSMFENFCKTAISGFISRANYNQDLFGLDIRDLYYWEQRMGVWGANMHNEMDPAVYSITGLNSRPLYESAFGLTPELRLGQKIMLDMTALYDKKFSDIGVVS